MDFYIMEVEVLHVPESPGMEHYHNGNDLTGAQFRPSLGLVSKEMFFDGFVKFNAEFIDKIENFDNFIVS